MRDYFLEDPIHPKGGIKIKCKDDHDCVFCKNCTDVFWDYTNGPYMVICSIGGDTKSGWVGHCKQFKEE